MDKIITYLEFYILIFVLLIISQRQNAFSLKKRSSILSVFVFLFILVFTFRTTGDDYVQYKRIFNDFEAKSFLQIIGASIFKYDIEVFWVILISVIKNIGGSFRLFLFISIFIPLFIVLKIIKKIEPEKCLMCFFWYILLNFEAGTNIVRQFVANNIFLLCIYLYSKSRIKATVSTGICNCFIHNAGFAGLPILYVSSKKYKRHFFAFFLFLGLFFSFTITYVFGNIHVDYSSFGNNRLLYKFMYYLFSYQSIRKQSGLEEHLITKIVNNGSVVITLLFQFLVIFYSLNRKKDNNIEKERFINVLLNSEIIGFFIYLFSLIIGIKTIGSRFNGMFCIGQFYLIYNLIENEKCYQKKSYFFNLFILLSVFKLIFSLMHNMYFGLPESIFYIAL